MRIFLAALFLAAAVAAAQDYDSYGTRGRDNIGPSNPTGGAATLASLDAGVIYLSDGTAALPALSWWADPNTGLTRAGEDRISVSAGSNVVATFHADAGVGWGSLLVTNGTMTPGFVANSSNSYLYGNFGTNGYLQWNGSIWNFNSAGVSSVNTMSGGLLFSAASGVAAVDTTTAGATFNFQGKRVFSGATPTISSGFGTSPSVTAGMATAFRVNVGTGGVATSGVITVGSTATNGWNCTCTDITTQSATVFLCKQTASTTTTVTIGNFDAAGAAAAWVASDIVAVSCVGY